MLVVIMLLMVAPVVVVPFACVPVGVWMGSMLNSVGATTIRGRLP